MYELSEVIQASEVSQSHETSGVSEVSRKSEVTEANVKTEVRSKHSSQPHDAGYDSLITAKVFIMQTELFFAAEKKNNADIMEEPAIPWCWMDLFPLTQFKGKVAAPAPPGYIDLGVEQEEYTH
eukprot:GHVN01090935.1.p1 GENE.GHVN01090935.1~~GHVN01090935.1.p1  ORF type:complete len:124 (-),score=54.27 GHVN01090935.1:36-407(-)